MQVGGTSASGEPGTGCAAWCDDEDEPADPAQLVSVHMAQEVTIANAPSYRKYSGRSGILRRSSERWLSAVVVQLGRGRSGGDGVGGAVRKGRQTSGMIADQRRKHGCSWCVGVGEEG